MLRRAAWAGQFYPAQSALLDSELEKWLAPGTAPRIDRPIGCVCPHAGYQYSGRVAGAVYSRMELPRRFFVLCPNHSGCGEPLAVVSAGKWETPLGHIVVDQGLASELTRRCHLLSEDLEAHRREHSLEVQLPFLQKLRPDMTFVPVAIGMEAFEAMEMLGEALAGAVRSAPEPVLIVASSDMNHFESDARTRLKDRRAIDCILALDPRGLYDTVRREHITMCGYCPAVAMLVAARRLGGVQAELVAYATSAEASGDYSRVVGYAGLVIW